ncbi:MAG: hydantoinase/oxoprolinase family protein [Rhodoferax sp.]|nr:hydantoinase/oxoprolinase family protein [Rhodoferax sp.]
MNDRHQNRSPDTRYLVGIDTGGTYTDAVVIEAQSRRVVAATKAITTKGDLSIGVVEALSGALGHLSDPQAMARVSLVSVSTTLATNAVVEGHGSPVAALLIGFDEAMVQRTGIAAAFKGVPLEVIRGGHDHAGEQRMPLDTEGLLAAIERVDASVDAFAVASAFAVRNPAHEHSARDAIRRLTGKPVTLSTELSSALDAPRRALTAFLNARLISRITRLVQAVQLAMSQLRIEAPLMIVKGDGTLALAESVMDRPIETVLSGPAASLVGAQWQSGLRDFILSDVGGTTTDLAVLRDGRPLIRPEGAEVGGWRTMVRAIDIRTIALGGDSEVGINSQGRVVLGAQRIVPVALMADRYPELLAMLEADLADIDGANSLHGRFVSLPFGARSGTGAGELTPREQEVLARVTAAPRPLRAVQDSQAAQRALASLRRKGLIQMSGLTPSDAALVLGLQSNWAVQGARMALQLAARLRDMQFPTEERTHRLAHDIWSETVRLTGHAVLNMALGQDSQDNPLVRAVCLGQPLVGLVGVSLAPQVPVVAVGGPAKVFYPEVARRLGCEVVYPERGEVANAVGAATGIVARTVEVRVLGNGAGLYRVQSAYGQGQYSDPQVALDRARALAGDTAVRQVLEMGARQPEVRVTVQKTLLPDSRGDAGLLEAVVQAEAIGRPDFIS